MTWPLSRRKRAPSRWHESARRLALRHNPRVKSRTSRKAARAPEWGITVRLNNGSRLYYSTRLDASGQPDWTPRVTEARRFATESEAAEQAAPMQTNRTAMEYEVVHLPQP